MGMLDDLRNAPATDSGTGEDFAPSWRWERPGDGVEGTVISLSSRVHENHPEGYPIVTVRQDNGEDLAIHGMATVLKNEINDRGLRVGDRLAVVYDGRKTSRAGREFNAFRVASEQGHGGPVPPPAPAGAPQPPAGYSAPQPTYAAPPAPAQPPYQAPAVPPMQYDDVPPF